MSEQIGSTLEAGALGAREYAQIRRLAYEKFGLDLRDGKQSLVAARLGKKIRQLQLGSFREYCRHLEEDTTGEALAGMVDALTTNHTSFFREPAHFDFLREKILPQLRRRERATIWSAACSSGEEPYSIAFSILEELGEAGLAQVRILATDISRPVLARAQAGIYPEDRFTGIPGPQLRRYVLRGSSRFAGTYRIKPQLRAAVEFHRLNLMERFPHVGPFPAIFCRNVMIYFDKPTQQDLVQRLADRLEPGGHLFIGHSESLNGLSHPLQYVRPAVYRRPTTGAADGPGKNRP